MEPHKQEGLTNPSKKLNVLQFVFCDIFLTTFHYTLRIKEPFFPLNVAKTKKKIWSKKKSMQKCVTNYKEFLTYSIKFIMQLVYMVIIIENAGRCRCGEICWLIVCPLFSRSKNHTFQGFLPESLDELLWVTFFRALFARY